MRLPTSWLHALLCGLMTFGLLVSGGDARAQLPPPGRNAIVPTLVAEAPAPPGGGRVTLAIAMRPEPGWHGYWKNGGDAGQPPEVTWTLPSGAAAGPLQYPVPGRLLISGLMNYVYEGPHAYLVTVNVPPAPAGGVLPLRARMRWLACTDSICVPEEGALALDLPVGGAADPTARARFDGFRRSLPRPLATPASFALADGRFRLSVPVPAGSAAPDPYFFPADQPPFGYAAAQSFTRVGDALVGEVAAGGGAPATLAGVLALGDGTGLAIEARPGVVPSLRDAKGPWFATLLAVLGAVAGGLILNVMPCVFPILSLKALSLARAGGGEREARRDAVAYAAGAVLTCAVLGGALLLLRASGEAAGWAFQLQSPSVVLLLLLLTTAIALNLAGLFQVPAFGGGGRLAGRGGAAGSFGTGALAAFVATPCTGPFLGAALGATLVLPPAASVAVFAGLGLGLALPFLLLGFVPALRARLPRPGAWMERVRRFLSLPMFATALALAWVLGRQSGVTGMTVGVAATLVVALGLWWLGRRQVVGGGAGWLPLLPLAAAALAGPLALPVGNAAPASHPLTAEPFDEARLAALRAAGRPVFVYFTADWCVSCKVNERVAIDRAEVAATFARAGVATLVGDWTGGDPAIGRFLEAQGRTGVPLYLYYPPRAEPRLLPQLLSAGMLTALVKS